MRRAHTLPLLMLVYGASSLLHFVHNAVYIQSYPSRWVGLLAAPLGAHSIAMNATILVEVATASALLIFVARSGLSARRHLEAP
jgi:hypothetical protein